MENVTSLKQGALMLFDNQRAQWSRMYGVLTADGCSLHSTCGSGSGVSRPNRPLIRPADIVTLYRANADDESLPQLHYVVFGLELKDREILLLRTAEPKGTKEWTKALETLMGSNAAVKTIDDLRAFRSFFTPQLYSQLFRGRPDVTAKIALTAHANKVPAAPMSIKAMPRRSSLSAQTPSRNATLPLRRPPLIPIVAATFRVDPVPVPAPQQSATTVSTAPPSKAEAASPSSSPKRVLATRDRNASPSSPKQKGTTAPTPVEEERTPAPSSPKEKKLLLLEEEEPIPTIEANYTVAENQVIESQQTESTVGATGEEEPLSEVSPRKTMERLNRLKRAASQSSQFTDEVVANLRKQVESLTRRNIDLQVCDLNNQQRIFELEGLLHESEGEVDRLKSRVSMFQRQLEVKDATFEERLREEKAELMETLKEEVQQQWAAMRKVFEEKEAQYKQEIERLTISAMGF